MTETEFEIVKATKKANFYPNNYLDESDLLFVVSILGEKRQTISLTEHRPSITYQGIAYSAFNDTIWVGGEEVPLGYSKLERLDSLEIFVASPENAETTFFIVNPNKFFVISHEKEIADFLIPSDNQVVIRKEHFIIDANEGYLYYNNTRLSGHHVIDGIQTGHQILTPDFLLEKRSTQWKITVFDAHVAFIKAKTMPLRRYFRQPRAIEVPDDFPKYRRSPRLHLEPPEDKFKVEKIEAAQPTAKNGLLKAILPPIGMLAVTGLTSVLSGRNPLMMLGMGFMSLMTAAFTASQYVTEKKERKLADEKRKEDFDLYLIDATAEIDRKYEEETKVLNFRNPAPEALSELVQAYDARIYERMTNNKDFLEVSLGTGDKASNLTIDAEVTSRETDEDSLRVKKVVDLYSTQRNVPITLSLMGQTLGLVGTYPVLKTAVSNLLWQVAFFHSYREVNFISFVPEKEDMKDWGAFRLLPHFKLQELGLRGLIHDAKTRDIVLSSFYQLLNQRKQVLQEASKEKPQFSPHYILTIFDDSYLAGHGINEFLAEDMSELGATVIWCKEDQKLLPETVTALVAYKNKVAGEIINDHNVYVAKDFLPYKELPDLDKSLRKLSKLEHVEVEKNAIPESLSS